MAKLFEYVVIYDGKRDPDTDEYTEKPELLERGEALVEKVEEAQILAARAIPEAHLDHLERVTIVVRPF